MTLAAKAPRRHEALVQLYGTRRIDFEAPDSSITFLARDLKAPAPHAQPGLSAVRRRPRPAPRSPPLVRHHARGPAPYGP
ncbi:hypothetical protein ACFXB3_01235 [Streptomyces sp. NPDC059447]|uniref:hypothetical protein n=1 Tax=Streptomyces sp. NPDC059447 TaxID=3346834 RepID=UPI00367D183E